jgi:hypothetical protein
VRAREGRARGRRASRPPPDHEAVYWPSMGSSRKRAETKGTSARRAVKTASRGAGAAGRKTAAPLSSAAKKNEKASAKTRSARPAGSQSPRTKRGAPAPTAPKKRAAVRTAKAGKAPVVVRKPPARRGAAALTAAVEPAAAKTKTRARVRKRAATGSRSTATANAAVAPHALDGLNEEDQIRAAKYLPRELPKRIFEEERFIFPETYGVNRVRLLVRDPEWIFAYWDVSPAAMKDFAKSIGERALALSRLTLRVIDPVSGGSTDILLPPGARWWYVRTDHARRTYRAELGVTLPSGEFRRLAESNTVVTPRVGPSPERARRRLSYPEARELPLSAAAAASEAEKRAGVAHAPWAPGAVEGAETPASVAGRTGQAGKGGASDAFRPGGASDAFPGASDTFRR